MHVQIVKQPENGSVSKSTDNKSPILPRNIISLPRFDPDENQPTKEACSKGSPSSKMLKTRKLNDWMSQLDNALNNPSANSMTVLEKSNAEDLSEILVSQTGMHPQIHTHTHIYTHIYIHSYEIGIKTNLYMLLCIAQ
jgi:hypothetical protein